MNEAIQFSLFPISQVHQDLCRIGNQSHHLQQSGTFSFISYIVCTLHTVELNYPEMLLLPPKWSKMCGEV